MSFDIEDIPDIESAGKLGRRPSPDSRVSEAYPLHPRDPGDVFGTVGVPMALKLVDKDTVSNGFGKEPEADNDPVGEKEAVAKG